MAELTTSLVLQERSYGGRTYKLSEEKIEGFVDGVDSLKQAIYKILSTERYEYPIYSFNYGIAWKELIGEERPYVRAEMKRMIQEALLQDDRILEVDGFVFDFSAVNGSKRSIKFWLRVSRTGNGFSTKRRPTRRSSS